MKRLWVDWVFAEASLVITDAQGIDYMKELEILTDGEINDL